jgi:hypothetical protein
MTTVATTKADLRVKLLERYECDDFPGKIAAFRALKELRQWSRRQAIKQINASSDDLRTQFTNEWSVCKRLDATGRKHKVAPIDAILELLLATEIDDSSAGSDPSTAMEEEAGAETRKRKPETKGETTKVDADADTELHACPLTRTVHSGPDRPSCHACTRSNLDISCRCPSCNLVFCTDCFVNASSGGSRPTKRRRTDHRNAKHFLSARQRRPGHRRRSDHGRYAATTTTATPVDAGGDKDKELQRYLTTATAALVAMKGCFGVEAMSQLQRTIVDGLSKRLE